MPHKKIHLKSHILQNFQTIFFKMYILYIHTLYNTYFFYVYDIYIYIYT